MNRGLPFIVAAASALWLAWQLIYGLSPLPDPMVSQFGFDGRPSNVMSKSAYSLIMALITGWIAIIFLAIGFLGHLPDRLINVPSREHWLAPERREATLVRVVVHTRWMLALTMAFLAAVSWLVIDGNAERPPRLSTAFLWLLAAFVVGTVAMVVRLVLDFRRPKEVSN